MPKVSVLMPVYNTKEEYLREAIESILAQTFTDFELIIVDNGSETYIKAIIDTYKDERIQYTRLEQNQGPAIARNYGIERSVGKYIAFMDSDDVSLPERLQKEVDFLEDNPEIDCLGAAVKTIEEKQEHITFSQERKHFDIEFALAFAGCTFCQSSVMLRKSVLENTKIRYEADFVPAEDYGLYVTLLGKAGFVILDDILVYYRFYSENTSSKHQKEQAEKSFTIKCMAIEKYCSLLGIDASLFLKFFKKETLTASELNELCYCLKLLKDKSRQRGCAEACLTSILKKFVKKNYYHTRSLAGQWNLIKSPIGKMFNFSFGSRLICLITRGLL